MFCPRGAGLTSSYNGPAGALGTEPIHQTDYILLSIAILNLVDFDPSKHSKQYTSLERYSKAIECKL